jgi:hypothetical protein
VKLKITRSGKWLAAITTKCHSRWAVWSDFIRQPVDAQYDGAALDQALTYLLLLPNFGPL